MPTVFWSLSERTKSLTIMKKNIKYKLELTTGIHAYIDHVFVNIREFEMPRQLTATKMSHEKRIHIFLVSIVIIPTRLLS